MKEVLIYQLNDSVPTAIKNVSIVEVSDALVKVYSSYETQEILRIFPLSTIRQIIQTEETQKQ